MVGQPHVRRAVIARIWCQHDDGLPLQTMQRLRYSGLPNPCRTGEIGRSKRPAAVEVPDQPPFGAVQWHRQSGVELLVARSRTPQVREPAQSIHERGQGILSVRSSLRHPSTVPRAYSFLWIPIAAREPRIGEIMSRTIVVTGAASGLGAATADAIEADGDRVIRLDLREGDIAVDLSSREGRAEAVAEIQEVSGASLDGIVTWAGLGSGGVQTLLVNYFGTVDLIEGVRELLTRSPQPRVVVTSSRMSLFPADQALVKQLLDHDLEAIEQLGDEPEQSFYYKATKTATAKWMRLHAIAPEWGGAGIKVNAIAPGLIETPMTRSTLDSPEYAKFLLDMHPQAEDVLSQPSEIAQIARFLASPAAGILVGQCLWADRGTEAIERGDDIW